MAAGAVLLAGAIANTGVAAEVRAAAERHHGRKRDQRGNHRHPENERRSPDHWASRTSKIRSPGIANAGSDASHVARTALPGTVDLFGYGVLYSASESRIFATSTHGLDTAVSDVAVMAFETGVLVTVANGKGALARVAAALASAEADITHVDMDDERAQDATDLRFVVSVRDRTHLADVIRRLRRLNVVQGVRRQ